MTTAESGEDESIAELPIACTLTPEALRTRREGLLMDLVGRAVRRDDFSNSLRLRFLRFGMTVEPDGGPLFLDLTGPPGTRDFISALIEG